MPLTTDTQSHSRRIQRRKFCVCVCMCVDKAVFPCMCVHACACSLGGFPERAV